MKLQDKIIQLRKSKGWSQEDLAEKLNVSRQAVSRWENGSALPDANNIFQLSKLFGVTADYLLNDDQDKTDDPQKQRDVFDVFNSNKFRKKRLSIVASICFLMAAGVWLFLAIDFLNIGYAMLAIVNALLSSVNLYFYTKNNKITPKN